MLATPLMPCYATLSPLNTLSSIYFSAVCRCQEWRLKYYAAAATPRRAYAQRMRRYAIAIWQTDARYATCYAPGKSDENITRDDAVTLFYTRYRLPPASFCFGKCHICCRAVSDDDMALLLYDASDIFIFTAYFFFFFFHF